MSSARAAGTALLIVACVRTPVREPAAEPPPLAPVASELVAVPEPVVDVPAPAPDAAALAAEVARLFAARCHECHGPRQRPKGGLRLSQMSALLARPAAEALIVPGDPARSPLFARLLLPAEHEDVMPPEDGPLAAPELELVRRWIAAGAPWSAELERDASAERVLPAEPIAALTDEQRAHRDAALALLAARGAHARRLSAAGDAVEVDLAVALPPATALDLQLLRGLEPCLVELSLARTRLSAAELAPLSAFGALRRLRLDHVPLGDGELAFLAALDQLESLNLYGARLSPAALPGLAELHSLRRLYLGATGFDAAQVAELARALPACTVFGDEAR